MPITPSDLRYKLSVRTGSAGNSTAGSASGSLGKYISTTEVADASLHNLFDVITGDENVASDVEYRCFFIHNTHATLALLGAVAWLASETSGGAAAAIGADTTAASAAGATSAQALEVVNEQTAPVGVTFSAPTSKGAGVLLGDIGPGQVKAIWVRRTAANTPALDTDGVAIRVEGDTAA